MGQEPPKPIDWSSPEGAIQAGLLPRVTHPDALVKPLAKTSSPLRSIAHKTFTRLRAITAWW